jgi:hypothetical protein
MLAAVGRERPAQTIAPVVEALSSMDAGWGLEAVLRAAVNTRSGWLPTR